MESSIVNLAVIDTVRLSGIDFRKQKPGRAFSLADLKGKSAKIKF